MTQYITPYAAEDGSGIGWWSNNIQLAKHIITRDFKAAATGLKLSPYSITIQYQNTTTCSSHRTISCSYAYLSETVYHDGLGMDRRSFLRYIDQPCLPIAIRRPEDKSDDNSQIT